ncbi:MAG: inositol monophosphatase family protein [Chloroflexi bacterium]|nr:inositol monophosphatase family protein [Chloroflexota bacterium]
MTLPTLADLERLARQAGQILSESYEKDHKVDYKGVIDLVTEVDHASEKFLIDEISRLFPGHSFLAEESGASADQTEHLWIIDPLDGTVNYAHGVPLFCVSIAYSYHGQVILGAVYDPMRDEMFSAERGKGSWVNGRPLKASTSDELQKSLLVTGFPYDSWNAKPSNFDFFVKLGKMTQGVRRLGSAALDLCYIAAGRLDGYWELSLKAWDLAAGGLIAEEAGALVTNITGGSNYLAAPISILAASQALHPKMLEQLKFE